MDSTRFLSFLRTLYGYAQHLVLDLCLHCRDGRLNRIPEFATSYLRMALSSGRTASQHLQKEPLQPDFIGNVFSHVMIKSARKVALRNTASDLRRQQDNAPWWNT
ncbi:hypothetical protein KC350_g59 [Hortaea werneckii]|nr:hypothetical protein KC350_g59 [Hortaea werneckii]